jgi:retron-type reverse transcriptase
MMRVGYLTDRIADLENLRLAFWKAKKKKAGSADVGAFAAGLDKNLLSLSNEISNGIVSVGEYSYFKVYDPKERLICAASFRERVLHHAIMNVCDPIFERFQIHDSYATRRGKGQFAALERVKSWIRSGEWFCKLDARKYFDSISHEILYKQLSDRFKDRRLLDIFKQIIDSYSVSPGRGVPIGNLTSQYFANFYLAHFDHFAKEGLKIRNYARHAEPLFAFVRFAESLSLRRCAIKKTEIG